MMCQHCQHAPCETVCPVLATTTSSEGINQQVYNRCIGTRYCANNCPYKVRRFNWHDYTANDDFPYNMTSPLGRLVLNPDVTVRSRGVMEKCNLCVQRIQLGKNQALLQRRPLADGDITTACQQACPTGAIVFGDLADPDSRVSRLLAGKRAYRVLEELGTRPNVGYLKKIDAQGEGMSAGGIHTADPPTGATPDILPATRWIEGTPSLHRITTDIARPMEAKPGRGWWICFAIASAAVLNLLLMVGYLFAKGIGIWGLNNAVGWAFDITNFVFWIGIGHAGTLISAILLLFRQKWRTSINRSAEAMTIFAVMCAGLFPLIHMGRPWDAFFIFPYFPNQRGPLWVNFRSPLVWDVFAISTYFTISLVFWYLGLIPDLATLRDRAVGGIKKSSSASSASAGTARSGPGRATRSSAWCWPALATPLVLSVHSIVSIDFATSLVPGWHTTIFPPYFVAGAIYSGFGMVLTLLIITRQTMHLERYITVNHLEAMAKVTLLTGSLVGYAYATEFFIAWYSGNVYERFHFINRATGPYAWCFYLMVLCNVLTPQLLWWKRIRRSVRAAVRACRSWSTSACGSNASSSSWCRCTATSCRRPGGCSIRRCSTSGS